jgi:aminopeptidase
MPDPRSANLAKIIVDYSVTIKEGDEVLISSSVAGVPLVTELYRLCIRRGAHVTTDIAIPGLQEIFLKEAGDAQLRHVSPVEQYVIEHFDVTLDVMADINTRQMSAVDPARQAMRSTARRTVMDTFMRRSGTGELRWNATLQPTEASAQEADMSLADFENFAYGACLADLPDPVAAWEEVKARQQRLIDWLAGKREVHLLGPGTDLRLGIAARPFVNCWGDKNMPDGEVFTGPEESRVDGHVRFSFPAIYGGREVEDVGLWFEKGVVVKAVAAKNEAFLQKMLDTDEGSRRLGEFAFGTNFGISRFVKNMLFDEKIGGTVHMALGAGYPETGSRNESAIHWDMLCDLRTGSEVRVDGELFARDGEYLPWK